MGAKNGRGDRLVANTERVPRLKRGWAATVWLSVLVVATALFLNGSLRLLHGNYLPPVAASVVSLLPGFFVCMYLQYGTDTESLALLICFVLGALAVPIASTANAYSMGYIGKTAGFLAPALFYLVGGVLEEGAKSLTAYSFGERKDAGTVRYAVVCAFVGLGFVAGENALYAVQSALPSGGIGFVVGRGMASPVHVALSGIAGAYIGKAESGGGGMDIRTVSAGVLFVSVLHASYNAVVLELSPGGVLLSDSSTVHKLLVSTAFLAILAILAYLLYRVTDNPKEATLGSEDRSESWFR